MHFDLHDPNILLIQIRRLSSLISQIELASF